ELALARTLISLRGLSGKPVPIRVDHNVKPTFGGVAVDRRFVVLVSPAVARGRGESLTLSARDLSPEYDAQPHTASITVADPMSSSGLACGGYHEQCEIDGTSVKTSSREVHIRFNNPIAVPPLALRQHVMVTPSVRNLVVTRLGWDDSVLIISGG